MSKNSFGQMYRRLSSKILDLVVTPHVLGDVPPTTTSLATTDQPLEQSTAIQSTPLKYVCYVLQNHSRSNALVLDSETRRLQLPPALEELTIAQHHEKNSVFYLQKPD
ncbi:MAG: glycerol-3-phosphate 1-O-acyltransferase PlsB, partial [Acinetobacter sp.]